jgi:aryl-alcohol dehydrogenase-like predicted oxidoreductase
MRSWWATRSAPVRDAVVIATKFGWKDGNARTGELDSRPSESAWSPSSR